MDAFAALQFPSRRHLGHHVKAVDSLDRRVLWLTPRRAGQDLVNVPAVGKGKLGRLTHICLDPIVSSPPKE